MYLIDAKNSIEATMRRERDETEFIRHIADMIKHGDETKKVCYHNRRK